MPDGRQLLGHFPPLPLFRSVERPFCKGSGRGEARSPEGSLPALLRGRLGGLLRRLLLVCRHLCHLPSLPWVRCRAIRAHPLPAEPTRRTLQRRRLRSRRSQPRADESASFSGRAIHHIRDTSRPCSCRVGSESTHHTKDTWSFSFASLSVAPCFPPCATWKLRS